MKIVKTASGKQQIKMSKKEWEAIGRKAQWMTDDMGGDDGIVHDPVSEITDLASSNPQKFEDLLRSNPDVCDELSTLIRHQEDNRGDDTSDALLEELLKGHGKI